MPAGSRRRSAASAKSSLGAPRTRPRRSRDARPANTATPVGWAALTAPTSAHSRPRCPRRRRPGSCTLKPWSIVTEVLFDKNRRRASGVRVLDAVTEQSSDYHGEGRFRLRLHAQLDLAADALGDRHLAGRARQQFGRAWAQPHGSSFPLRRRGKHRGLGRQVLLRPPAQRHLYSALSQFVRRQARLLARLRLPGQREPGRMVAGREGARESVRPSRTRWRRRARGRFGATAFGEMLPNHANSVGLDGARKDKWGLAGAQDRLRDGRERAPDAQGHDGRHGGDAGANRCERE